MKKIKFAELNVKGVNLIWVLLLLVASLMPGLLLFDVITFADPKTAKWINVACFLVLMLYFLQPFLYSHYVQWNRKGIMIRVNSWLGNNFRFSDISDVVYAADSYTIRTQNGKEAVIDLSNIEPSSKERLLGILRQYTE